MNDDTEEIAVITFLARLDGWKSYIGKTDKDLKFRHSDGRRVRSWKDLPRYTRSFDVIIPLIQRQNQGWILSMLYTNNLCKPTNLATALYQELQSYVTNQDRNRMP